MVLLYIIDISPGGDVRTEGYADDPVHTEFFQLAEYPCIGIRIIRRERRGNQKGDLLTFSQVFKEPFGIVAEIAGIMFTDIKAGTAGYAKPSVNHDPRIPVFVRLRRYTGTDAAACADTLIAADTLVIRIYKAFFNVPHMLSPVCQIREPSCKRLPVNSIKDFPGKQLNNQKKNTIYYFSGVYQKEGFFQR
jgi:hypothetical protein